MSRKRRGKPERKRKAPEPSKPAPPARVGPAERAAARYVLLGATLFLTLLGLVMVYSASSVMDYVKEPHDAAFHLKRQFMYVAAGLVLVGLGLVWDLRRARKVVSWGMLFGFDALLVLVLTHGVGKWGAQRWLDIGPFTIQPSEWVKLGVVLALADVITEYHQRRIDLNTAAKRVAIAVGIPVVLVMIQPDMGTTVTIVLAALVVLVLGGLPKRYIGGLGAGLAGMGAVAIALAPYRMARLLAFLDPWSDPKDGGYQTIQALYAFGSGGIAGVGLGMSRQKFFYLPAAHTDFIFAIIAEELGLLGTVSVAIAFGAFAWAGLRIAQSLRDPFARLVVGGLTGMVTLQAVMNMAAVTGLMPVTGIPLPLVSSGGSSMTFTMACIGLILAAERAAGKRHGRSEEGSTTGASGRERRRDSRTHLSSIDGGRAAARRRA